MQRKDGIECPNPQCKAALKRPYSVYNTCPSCKVPFFHFCHEFPWKLFQRVQCKRCPNNLYYFFCKECSAIQAYQSSQYRMGGVCSCKCQAQYSYLVCPKCNQAQVFPADYRYEGIQWKCQYCSQKYAFVTCDVCCVQTYKKDAYKDNDKVKCSNNQCAAQMTIRKCKLCQVVFADSKGSEACFDCVQKQKSIKKQPVTPQLYPSLVMEPTPSTDKDSQLCKVCFERQADHINTVCFHLVVCGTCVTGMKGACPICRTSGDFRKVFK